MTKHKQSDPIQAISKAYAVRLELIQKSQETNAFRLFGGANEGIPGFVVEQYADCILFQNFEGTSKLTELELSDLAEWYLKNTSSTSVYLKPFQQNRSDKKVEELREKSRLLKGCPCKEDVLIRENGLQFILRPYEGFSSGIFLDQRANRLWLAEDCQAKRVLNCFAYTCAFSVYAAKMGAMTTNVDVSRKYLDWGKENFSVNGLEIDKHQFYSSDVFFHFKKAIQSQTKYDLIILDPPSFSRNKEGIVFSVKKDMERLLTVALQTLEEKGKLFVSTNFAEWNSRDLSTLCEGVFQDEKLRVTKLSLPCPPIDFSFQESNLAAVCFQRD